MDRGRVDETRRGDGHGLDRDARELLDALRTHVRPTTFDRLETLLDLLSRGGAFPELPPVQTDETHQRWANYAMWAVHLRRLMLADRLKEYLAESNPLNDHPSVFADIQMA